MIRALLAAALLAACGGQRSEAPSGDTLVVAAPFDPGNVNPLVAPYQLSGMITNLVQPGLVRRQVGEDGLFYAPDLAVSWDWSEDGRTLTYQLRPGLQWEDGTPLTAEDVVFTYELIADPRVASNWHGDARDLEAVEAPDPHTVVFRFAAARNPLLQQGVTIRGVVPRHVLQDADRSTLRGHPSGRAPLASGPFRVASWTPDQAVVLQPNPAAPEDWQPRLGRIVFRVMPEYATRRLELERGGLDLMGGLQVEDVQPLAALPHLRVERLPSDSMQYIGYRLDDPRFADPRVRRALTLALDRDKLVRDLLTVDGEVHGRPCIGTVAPTLGAWHADEVTPLPHDLQAARSLLQEAGWVPDRDGVLRKDGQALRFRLMVQTGYTQLRSLAEMAQAMWREVGVQLDLELVEPTRFSDRARGGDFEAILWSFGANPRVDLSINWRSDGQYNWFGYHNPEVDALIDRANAALDPAEAQAAVREAQARIHDDQPMSCLFWQDGFVAVHSRFRDVEMNPFTVLANAERWWVPDEERRHRR